MTLLSTEPETEFGEKLKAWRKARGLTMQELADKVGMLQPALARLESGGRQPSWATVKKLAAALGITPDGFLSGPVPKGKRRKKSS